MAKSQKMRDHNAYNASYVPDKYYRPCKSDPTKYLQKQKQQIVFNNDTKRGLRITGELNIISSYMSGAHPKFLVSFNPAELEESPEKDLLNTLSSSGVSPTKNCDYLIAQGDIVSPASISSLSETCHRFHTKYAVRSLPITVDLFIFEWQKNGVNHTGAKASRIVVDFPGRME